MSHEKDKSPLIAELIDVDSHYKGGPQIFKKLTVAIKKGAFYTLIGPRGSGKSSLLKMFYLSLKPTSGDLRLFGEDPLRMPPSLLPTLRQKLGGVFKEFQLLDHLNVVDNVSLPLRVRGARAQDARAQAEELLTWVGLGDALTVYPSILSSDQKQCATIARAIVTQPQLLLADEPTENMDNRTTLKLLHLFEELNRMGTTIILATHSHTLIENSPHPRLFLKDGFISEKRST